jgi:hypothetical protein
MKNLTITLSEDTLSRVRVAAAKEGKSMSRFVAELVEGRIGRKLTQREAVEAFLAGPSLPLLDDNGKAPTRDSLYDD